MSVDHYNTLGVIPTASAADLRAAYLKLARTHHPDKVDSSEREQAEVRMQQINEAWSVLGVAHKRREYDIKRPKTRTQTTTGRSKKQRGHAHFKPFDDEPISRADIDLDTTPIAGSKGIPRWATFLPVGLFVFGILTLGFGTLVGAGGVFALGIICVVLGGVCFLMLPLIVMSRAERDPDL
jgi:hypothetical protein